MTMFSKKLKDLLRKHTALVFLCVGAVICGFTAHALADDGLIVARDKVSEDQISKSLIEFEYSSLTELQDKSRKTRMSYALGISEGTNARAAMLELQDAGLTLNYKVVLAGFLDALKGVPGMDQKEFDEAFEELEIDAQQALANREQEKLREEQRILDENLVKAKKYMESNSREANVISLPSGLQYQVVKAGIGNTPSLTDKVKIHYSGRLVDGHEFDSTYKKGEPGVFRLDTVIPGWQESLLKMKEGDIWRVYVPPHLGYGEMAYTDVAANSVLIFELELVEVYAQLY